MKIQINVEVPKGKEEFKEAIFKELCGEFGAKNLHKFVKYYGPIFSSPFREIGSRHQGVFHILTDEQIRDIQSLIYHNTDIHIIHSFNAILDRPIEELSKVNDITN